MNQPSKVVHAVRSNAFAGVERYVCEVAAGLATRGWEVVVVGGDPARMRGHLPTDVRHVPATSTAAVARALLGADAALVHSHMTAADVAACLTRPLTGAVLVSTRHFPAPRGARPRVRQALRPLLRALDVRIAISDYVAASTAEPEQVLLSGVRDRDLVPVAERTRQVVVLQRLEPEKDTATALRAWADSRLPGQGWLLKIAGVGSEEQPLRTLAAALGVNGSVEFLGFVEDPAPLLASAAALLAPTPVEAYGLAVVEAMASGTPVVAADGGGHVETLGSNAWLFTSGRHDECARLLDRLEEDPRGAAAYGRSLHAAQRSRLTLAGHLHMLEGLYRQALEQRERR